MDKISSIIFLKKLYIFEDIIETDTQIECVSPYNLYKYLPKKLPEGMVIKKNQSNMSLIIKKTDSIDFRYTLSKFHGEVYNIIKDGNLKILQPEMLEYKDGRKET